LSHAASLSVRRAQLRLEGALFWCASGWQQIVAGPFASWTAADDAQRRLERKGFTGTQISSAR